MQLGFLHYHHLSLEYQKRSMGIREEEGLGTRKSSSITEVQCFHWVHFHFIQVDDIFPQLALPLDSDSCASGQYLSDSPTSPSPLEYFLHSIENPRKIKTATPADNNSSSQECLLQTQCNHGCLDLSLYFAPMDHTSTWSLNMVSCSICIQSSSFSLAQQCTSSPYNRTPPIFFLSWLSQSGCTSHLWWLQATRARNECLHIGN